MLKKVDKDIFDWDGEWCDDLIQDLQDSAQLPEAAIVVVRGADLRFASAHDRNLFALGLRVAESFYHAKHDEPVDPIKQTARLAFFLARDVVCGPTNETRVIASRDPVVAFLYAERIDRGPHEETRHGACVAPPAAFEYAKSIDKTPRNQTWQAVKGSSWEVDYMNEFPNWRAE